jgi:SNF2 family DNA or RNA helicase
MKTEITYLEQQRRVRVRSPYTPILVQRFRTIPGRQFVADDKAWTFPAVRDVVLMICDVVGILPTMLPEPLRSMMDDPFSAPAPPDIKLIDGMRFITSPYDHQRVGLARAIQSDRWLFAWEMGTGKSWVAANRILLGFELKQFEDVLIACPKSVVDGWQDQFAIHTRLVSALATGDARKRRAALRSQIGIKIANYEAILAALEDFAQVNWGCVVLDEIHRIKNFTAQSSKAIRRLTAPCKYVWGLSGTPAPNGLEDWLGVISAIDPNLLPVSNKTQFAERYLIRGRLGEDGPIVTQGYRNVVELHSFVNQITSRVTKAEALDLPPKVFSSRHCTLEGEQKRIYTEVRKQAVARLGAAQDQGTLTVRNVLTESLRLLQIVGGFVPDDTGKTHEIHLKARVQPLVDVIEEAGDRQIVVWCEFRDEVYFLQGYLAARFDCDTAGFTGGSNTGQRSDALETFKRGDARFFVATAAAGGTGINGLTCSDTEIYYSRGYNLATYLQSQDRLHRVGQHRAVSVVKVIAQNTVDERIDQCLDRKADMQEMLLQGTRVADLI